MLPTVVGTFLIMIRLSASQDVYSCSQWKQMIKLHNIKLFLKKVFSCPWFILPCTLATVSSSTLIPTTSQRAQDLNFIFDPHDLSSVMNLIESQSPFCQLTEAEDTVRNWDTRTNEQGSLSHHPFHTWPLRAAPLSDPQDNPSATYESTTL